MFLRAKPLNKLKFNAFSLAACKLKFSWQHRGRPIKKIEQSTAEREIGLEDNPMIQQSIN